MDGKSVYSTYEIENCMLKNATFPMCLLTPFKYLSSSNVLIIEYMSRCSRDFQLFLHLVTVYRKCVKPKNMSSLGTPELKHEDFSLAGT